MASGGEMFIRNSPLGSSSLSSPVHQYIDDQLQHISPRLHWRWSLVLEGEGTSHRCFRDKEGQFSLL